VHCFAFGRSLLGHGDVKMVLIVATAASMVTMSYCGHGFAFSTRRRESGVCLLYLHISTLPFSNL
jgi:hypothetical protein